MTAERPCPPPPMKQCCGCGKIIARHGWCDHYPVDIRLMLQNVRDRMLFECSAEGIKQQQEHEHFWRLYYLRSAINRYFNAFGETDELKQFRIEMSKLYPEEDWLPL